MRLQDTIQKQIVAAFKFTFSQIHQSRKQMLQDSSWKHQSRSAAQKTRKNKKSWQSFHLKSAVGTIQLSATD